jgi:hypothetical protein
MFRYYNGRVQGVDQCRMKAEKYGRNIIGLQRNGDCMIDILEDCTADRCFNALGKAPDE